MSPLGLIAGEGMFPLLVARGARAAGRRVVCAAFVDSAWESLRDDCDSFRWVGVVRLGEWIRVLRRAGCREAIMVGRVAKAEMYRGTWNWVRNLPDLRTLRLLATKLRRDRRPYTVLRTICDELASAGITLIDSTQYCKDHLTTPGVMTRRRPTDAQWEDLRYGWDLCQVISGRDIGQALAVYRRDILAVEAIEGTNAMIERAGELCRAGGWTLIKVANSTHDMRLDVPTIGMTTIEKLHAARGAVIVLEAGKTMMVEKPKVIELADRLGIALVGHAGGAGSSL